jgi:hypothetical protein
MSEKNEAIGQQGFLQGAGAIMAQTKMPYAAFTRQLRNPINDLPPYPQSLLSDQQVADIYAFLQGVPGRRQAKDIPILNNNY